MSKVYIFLAEGHEEIEALTVVDLLRRSGIDIETVSVTGNLKVTGSHRITTVADRLFEDIDCNDADMLVIPGGMPGTKNIEANEALMKNFDAFAASGRYIAAICAAPTVFGHRNLLTGKKACCYPGMEDGLLGAKVSYDNVCVDGNIITSRGLGTAIDFSLKIIEILTDAQKAQQTGKAVVYIR